MSSSPTLPGTAETIRLANDLQRYDIEVAVGKLPRIGTLPSPDELAELHRVTVELPVVVEETVTIRALVAHLQKTRANTPEVGLLFLPDGTQLVNAGTTDAVHYGIGWSHFEPHNVAEFHTHPDPTRITNGRVIEQRHPSLDDISVAARAGRPRRPYAIGSQDGLTVLNLPDGSMRGDKLWQEYVERRGFTTEEAFDDYGGEKLYGEFVQDVLNPGFTAWAAIDSNKTLFDQIVK